MKNISLLLISVASSILMAGNSSISLKYGLNSIENESSSKFKNNTLSLDGVYGIDYPIQPRVDLLYTKIKDKEKWGGVSSLLQLAVSGQYDIENDYRLSPYLFGGLGYESVSSSTKCFDSNPFLQLGGGLKYALTPSINLLGEIKALQMLGGGSQDNEFIVSLGANMPLQKSITPAPTPINTIKTASVVNNTQVVEVVDSDKDGVPDDKDDCPNTKAGVEVSKNGCEVQILLDSDNDGLTDDVDKCPNTPYNLRKNVDASGCAKEIKEIKKQNSDVKEFATEGDTINLHIEFDTYKHDIKPKYNKKIKEFAKYIKSLGPKTVVIINGYTDNSGNNAQNIKISRERAFAVRNALIKAGLKPSQVRAYGNGPLNPIATNDTADGRAKNRRIEAVIEKH